MRISMTINGSPRTLDVDPLTPLRDVLRQQGLVSVKLGCDGDGTCGACGVLVDGRQVNSCLLVAGQLEGASIRTVESLARMVHRPAGESVERPANSGPSGEGRPQACPGPVEDDTRSRGPKALGDPRSQPRGGETRGPARPRTLSALQSAFVDAGIVQCGYCTPAMLLAVTELLERAPRPTRDEVKDALSGTFCRCTGYEQVFGAVALAVELLADPAAPREGEVYRAEHRYVGRDTGKVDGATLARGEAAFVEDRVRPGHAHLKILGSPHAHAIIRRIDTSKAEALPGVVLVVTHETCPPVEYNQAGQGFPEPSPYDRRMFGRKVRHVGDRVAAVVAETREIAEQALGLIDVEYDVLPPVLTIEQAAAPDAPLVHGGEIAYVVGAPPDLAAVNATANPDDGRIVYQFPIHADPRRNIAAHVSGGIGDVATGFGQADVILERTYATSQVQSTPLEPHIVYTRMEGDRLVVHASTQVPWHVRRILARLLDVPENRIRVVKERTGGAFGAKQDIVLEEVAAWCTWVTGRDILFRYTREEEFIASRTRHPMTIGVKLGAKRDGALTAIEMTVKANTGPYGAHCLTVPMNACSKSLPLFLCEHVHFDVTTYYSNIPPTGAYQGYGAPQGSFALQTAVCELAHELSLDPLAVLEKNRVREGSMLEILRCLGEGREGIPQRVATCGLGPALDQGARLIGWGERAQAADPDVRIGKGVVIVQQGSGLPGLDSANAALTMFGDGTFMLLSGGTDLGTGLDTVTVKMAAETLCTPLDAVALTAADTDVTPFDVGAYASSGTYFSGGAALNAALEMKRLLLEVGAELLSEPRDNVRLEYPGLVRGRSGAVTYADIARHTQSGTGRGQLTALGHFITDKGSFPYGAHFCQVAVDTRTGVVKVQKYYALQDAGTPINPELAKGQILGGVLKTIGHSLYEDLVLDQHGRCQNPGFTDYKVPQIGDLPDDFRAVLVDTHDPFGPFGAKSVSEISTNGAAPAIAAAIHDAVGVWIRSWPFTPEKILRALGRL